MLYFCVIPFTVHCKHSEGTNRTNLFGFKSYRRNVHLLLGVFTITRFYHQLTMDAFSKLFGVSRI